MNPRNLKARKVVKALIDYGCVIKRNTDHGVIVENPKNGRSTNIPTHRDILENFAKFKFQNSLRKTLPRFPSEIAIMQSSL